MNCLDRIFASSKDFDSDAVVVSDAFFHGCGDMLRTDFPDTKSVRSTKNLGFAGQTT